MPKIKWCRNSTSCTIQSKSRVLASFFLNRQNWLGELFVYHASKEWFSCELSHVKSVSWSVWGLRLPVFSHLSLAWDATRNLPWDRVLWGHRVLLHLSRAHLICEGSALLVENCWYPAGAGASSMPDACPAYLTVCQFLGS